MIKLIKSTFYHEQETKEQLIAFIRTAEKLSIGEKVAEFEATFAHMQGRRFCTMMNSGSSANLALMQALLNMETLQRDDDVGFSALTWVTNVTPLLQLGLQARPLDVTLSNLNVSSEHVRQAHAERPLRALFITNLLGFAADLDQIAEYCREHDIILLEDNCESLGSVIGGKKLGNFGLASTFSFYVGHHLSTIEGGAVCTDDKDLDIMLKMVRAHGWDRNLSQADQHALRVQQGIDGSFYAPYTFYTLGYNFRPTEIQGFVGLVQLPYLAEMIRRREENFQRFQSALQKRSDAFLPLNVAHMDVVSNFAMPVICRNKELFNEFTHRFQQQDIEIRPIVGGSILEQPFFGKFAKSNVPMHNAHIIHQYGFYFGNNPELTDEEMATILATLA